MDRDIRAEKKDVLHFYRTYRGRIFGIYLLGLLGFAGLSLRDYIPETLSVQKGTEVSLGHFLPVTKTVKSGDGTVESFGMLSTKECGTYEMEVRLLGIIPVGDVTVHIVDDTQVIPRRRAHRHIRPHRRGAGGGRRGCGDRKREPEEPGQAYPEGRGLYFSSQRPAGF